MESFFKKRSRSVKKSISGRFSKKSSDLETNVQEGGAAERPFLVWKNLTVQMPGLKKNWWSTKRAPKETVLNNRESNQFLTQQSLSTVFFFFIHIYIYIYF